MRLQKHDVLLDHTILFNFKVGFCCCCEVLWIGSFNCPDSQPVIPGVSVQTSGSCANFWECWVLLILLWFDGDFEAFLHRWDSIVDVNHLYNIHSYHVRVLWRQTCSCELTLWGKGQGTGHAMSPWRSRRRCDWQASAPGSWRMLSLWLDEETKQAAYSFFSMTNLQWVLP